MASNLLNSSVFTPRVAPHRIPNGRAERTSREELALFARMLHQRHYVSGCDGNLSVRLDACRILATPTRMSKALLKPEHMVIVDLEGTKLEGALAPSSEIGMHLTIYKVRADVAGIVHAHPIVATAFACAGMDLGIKPATPTLYCRPQRDSHAGPRRGCLWRYALPGVLEYGNG